MVTLCAPLTGSITSFHSSAPASSASVAPAASRWITVYAAGA